MLELRKDADIEKIKNILYKKTKFEDTFGVNMLAIAGGRPETLNLKGILRNFLDFQYENTKRKYNVLLQKETDKKEVQEGLITACDCIDLIIAILRGSKNLKDAKACLTAGDVSNIRFKAVSYTHLSSPQSWGLSLDCLRYLTLRRSNSLPISTLTS